MQQITNKVEFFTNNDNKAEAKACIPLSDFRCYKDDDNGKTEGLLDMNNVDDDEDGQPKWIDDLKVVDLNEAGGENLFRETGERVDRDENKNVMGEVQKQNRRYFK